MTKYHDDDVNMLGVIGRINDVINPKTQRLRLTMIEGERYFLAGIEEEWRDALLIMPEALAGPMLVMKAAIQSIEPVVRPHQKDEKDGD